MRRARTGAAPARGPTAEAPPPIRERGREPSASNKKKGAPFPIIRLKLSQLGKNFLLKLQNKEDVGNLMDISVSIWGNTEFQKYLLSLNLPMNNQTTDDDRFFGYSFDAALSSYQSDDPAYHLIPKLDVIMSAGYEPSLDDILSLRITTTG